MVEWLDGASRRVGCIPHGKAQYHVLGCNPKVNNQESLMIMTENNAVVATYKFHTEAESAVKELQASGFNMKQLSIIGRDHKSTNMWSVTTIPVIE